MTTSHAFAEAFNGARRLDTRIMAATSPFEHVDGTTYRLTDDGLSGYAVRPDGELVYVFSLVRGRGDEIVTRAIQNGATYLDCFDGHLVTLYGRHGFVEVKREPNWTPGGPDVVYMSRES